MILMMIVVVWGEKEVEGVGIRRLGRGLCCGPVGEMMWVSVSTSVPD